MHFILCNNRLLETEQLLVRMKHVGFDDYIILSSTSTCKNLSSLKLQIIEEMKSKIVVCTNQQRLKDIKTLLNDQKKSEKGNKRQKAVIYNYYFWIDEADVSMLLLKPYVLEWSKDERVKQLYLITATPQSFWNCHKDIFKESCNIISLSKSFGENYYSLSECKWTIIDQPPKQNYIEYIENILESNKDKLTKKTRWFIPAYRKTETHDYVKDLLIKFDFAVLLINKKGKKLYTPNKPETDFSTIKKEELSKILSEHYNKNIIGKYNFAISGSNCIGRGVTFQNDKFTFNYAIFLPVNSDDSAYQLAGRLCGYRMRDLSKKQTESEIFTTNEMKKKLLINEAIAKEISKIAFTNSQNEFSSVKISKDKFDTLVNSLKNSSENQN